MVSLTTGRFWKAFDKLPAEVQTQAKKTYELWQKDPYHDSLQFKRIHTKRPIFSVRIGIHWRAIGVKEEETITWFWIGSHADYDKLVNSI
jgi:hypothetical protein